MNNSQNNNKRSPAVSPLELLRNINSGIKNDLLQPMPSEALRQILGNAKAVERKFSGEILPGSAIEMDDIFSGRAAREENLQKSLILERRQRMEEQTLVERRTNELRIQIQAIHEETQKVAKATASLSQEVQIAAFQAPASESIYELYFLERIFNFIKSFRKKIENASVWLLAMNRKAAKKNMWGANYKKQGAKYLLSSEHYLQRSAG